jgi:hypothetical protein
VIDLRLPQTQEWFFDYFKNGDGVHLSKPHGDIADFPAMLPTLMHPELGGCPTTYGIGSWMRTSRINGFIYPSARSDAMTLVREWQLESFNGWNMVDYRNTCEIASSEVIADKTPWYSFDQLGITYGRPRVTLHQPDSASTIAGSWAVRGVQARSDAIYKEIVGL